MFHTPKGNKSAGEILDALIGLSNAITLTRVVDDRSYIKHERDEPPELLSILYKMKVEYADAAYVFRVIKAFTGTFEHITRSSAHLLSKVVRCSVHSHLYLPISSNSKPLLEYIEDLVNAHYAPAEQAEKTQADIESAKEIQAYRIQEATDQLKQAKSHQISLENYIASLKK